MNSTSSITNTLSVSKMNHHHLNSEQTFETTYTSDFQSGEGTPDLTELKAMLQRQLEYYFSRENLSHDTFLVSQMDGDQYVPIITVANFNQVRRLTKDLKLIVEVLRESPNVEVDEAGEKVRPNCKCCVLILREIPETTAVKDIEALFSGEECPKSAKCEFAHNDTWYVTFESDEDVQKAYRYLREEVRTFQGKPIMARIKVKPVTRAPFIPHYKNGLRYQGPMVSPVNGQQDPSPPVQQQQWTEQAQHGLSYANEPSVSYSNQQVFPPFYPPTMLQACAPATPSAFEFGTIFVMNGLPPQAVFKSLNGTGRHGLHVSSARTHKPYVYRNQQKHNSLGLEQKETMPFVPSPPHGAAPILNRGISGFGYLPYPYANPYSLGMDMQDFFPYSKRYSHQYKQGQGNSHSSSHGPKSAFTSLSGTKESTDNKLPNQTKSANEFQGRDSSKQQRIHPRKKKKDDGNTKVEIGNSMKDSDSKDTKFDLEPASFPPLPGSQGVGASDSDMFENRLSDVVKGTSKPSGNDTVSQVEGTSDNLFSAVNDNHILANGDHISQALLTPPDSPVMDKRVLKHNNSAEGTCSSHIEPEQLTSESVSAGPETKTKPQPVTAHNSVSTSRMGDVISTTGSVTTTINTGHAVVPTHVGSLTGSSPTTCSSLPLSAVLTTTQLCPVSKNSQTDSGSFLVNGNIETMSTICSEDKGRKLTYSEVAQRAKESVEKLASELKEKERQEAVARQQRHMECPPNKHHATVQKTLPRDYSKQKATEQPCNFKDNERKTRNGSGPLHRTSPRSPREENKEEHTSSGSKIGK
ncbi:la-related protein 4-like isoform X2 [Limulus polyphemus]|nr:la-related protein 4-like isoform X2 [Limulus polyphemus]XP_022254551.1 la-related protein 4-like isoform X2 [Limulus polyphemus]XP_022254553.1 la-related protein 4-like isoform X2 [Limulus polyphemus]